MNLFTLLLSLGGWLLWLHVVTTYSQNPPTAKNRALSGISGLILYILNITYIFMV